jgi:hypothetical protein
MARAWLICVCFVVACKHDERPKSHHVMDAPERMAAASAAAGKLDRPVDLAPLLLTAKVDATWSCAPNDAKDVVCKKGNWSLSWKLENESSVKPDATLVSGEELDACTDIRHQPRCTIALDDVHGYHGLFNRLGRSQIVFVGWHGEAGDRTKLTIVADGGGSDEDAMAVMMTTAHK